VKKEKGEKKKTKENNVKKRKDLFLCDTLLKAKGFRIEL